MLTITINPQDKILFKNRKEIIIRDTYMGFGYFKLRDFKIDTSISCDSNQIIEAFIKSKYIYWKNTQVPFPDPNYKGKGKELNWNFHGIYDVTKIVSSDFVESPYNSFKKHLLDFVMDKTKDYEVVEGDKTILDFSLLIKNPLDFVSKIKGNNSKKKPDLKAKDEVERFIISMEKALEEYKNADNSFYILTTKDKIKLNSFTVFDYFFSAVMINKNTNTFLTIEFGLD